MSSYKNKEIQIVAFASPYPPNYGGVIDVYYKIEALHKAGVKVHLHTYIYDEHQPSKELEKICASVHYYKRGNTYKFLQGWPYIVSSRYNKTLAENVIKAGYEVILEGLHTTFLIPLLKNAGIPFSIRMHNIEWKYYLFLAELEPSYMKKKYFLEEARRLKSYEKIIEGCKILSISKQDTEYLKSAYPSTRVTDVPPFHKEAHPDISFGKGEYALFHANLSVNENEQAALWLIEKVFPNLTFPLIIAGKNPDKKIELAANAYPHVILEPNPSEMRMKELMREAQIHLLPNRQPTGMKIKWINALFTARFVIANPDICPYTQEDCGLYTASNEEQFIQTVSRLKDLPFTQEIFQNRENYLGKTYSNQKNIKLLF